MPDRTTGWEPPREVDRDRLVDLLGGDDLRWLRDRVRRRLEHGRPPVGTVTLGKPSDGQRAAVDRLLGRRPSSGARITVRLDAVGRILRDARICGGWRDAIEVLDGPVVDVVGRRRVADETWERVLVPPDRAPAWRREWLADLAATGLLRRLAGTPERGAALLDRAGAVLGELPVRGVSLQRLAAQVLGDSHALDDDRPTATLVLKALQHRHLPPGERGPLPTGVDQRSLWAAAGVMLDELSAPVLALNLPGRGGPVGDLLRSHAALGEPVRLTLRQLLRHPFRTDGAGDRVRVCENPAVVGAAAEALGPRCAPLVCTDGQPSAAAQTLLRMLGDAGTRLAYHGDYDRGGLRIASSVIGRFGARPWRMDTASYLAAPPGPPLIGPVAAVPWGPGLAEAMQRRGVAVHEEQVLDDLLGDLAG